MDDQLQEMKSHLEPWPKLQREGSSQLFLGGLPKSSALRNFSGCISNVFVLR